MGIYQIKPLGRGLTSPINGQAIKRETVLKLTPAQARNLLYANAEVYQLVNNKKIRINKDNCMIDFEKVNMDTKKEKNKEQKIIINSTQIDKKKPVVLDNNTIPAVHIPSIPIEEEKEVHDNDAANTTTNNKYISYNASSSNKHKPSNNANAQKKRYN